MVGVQSGWPAAEGEHLCVSGRVTSRWGSGVLVPLLLVLYLSSLSLSRKNQAPLGGRDPGTVLEPQGFGLAPFAFLSQA